MNPEDASSGKFDHDMMMLRLGLLPDAKLYVGPIEDEMDITKLTYSDVGSLKGVKIGFDPASEDENVTAYWNDFVNWAENLTLSEDALPPVYTTTTNSATYHAAFYDKFIMDQMKEMQDRFTKEYFGVMPDDGEPWHYDYQGPGMTEEKLYGTVNDPRDFSPGSYMYTVRQALSLGCGMNVYIHDRTLNKAGLPIKEWFIDGEAPYGQLVEYVVD